MNQKQENDAWDIASLIQKIALKIKFSAQMKQFKWPIIVDSDNKRFVHRSNSGQNKSYYQCQQYRNNCHATCIIELDSCKIIFNKGHNKQIPHNTQRKPEDINTLNTPKKFIDAAKRLAIEKPTLPSSQIYEELVSNNTIESIIVPTKQEICRTLDNTRNNNNLKLRDLEQIINIKTK